MGDAQDVTCRDVPVGSAGTGPEDGPFDARTGSDGAANRPAEAGGGGASGAAPTGADA